MMGAQSDPGTFFRDDPPMTVVIVNSGAGNLASVAAALRHVGAPSVSITSDPAEVKAADAVILPGVGAFGAAMRHLHAAGLVAPLREVADAGRPMLGICLGMQLLAAVSEEFGEHAGLDLIPGRVVRLQPSVPGTPVPHIGWARVTPARAGLLPLSGDFYHVHSFHMKVAGEHLSGTIDYGGETVAVAVEKGMLCGVQFHPEKSQDAGLDLLAAFLRLARQ